MTPYIIGQSKAIFGTWFYFPMYNLMFDCGESAAYSLGIHTADIKYIFISHFHKDHYLGLISVGTFLTRVTRKVKRKIKVFYHIDSAKEIEKIKEALKNLEIDSAFDFVSFKIGDKIDIEGKKYITPFEVNHSAKYYRSKITACGFRLFEERKNIKDEYKIELDKLESNISKAKYIKSISKKDKNIYNINEYNFITYCGDSYPIDFKNLEKTEILMHECTFLTKKELDAAHTDLETLKEKIKDLKKEKVGRIILYHLSEKYLREEKDYKNIILNELKNTGISIDIVELNRQYRLLT